MDTGNRYKRILLVVPPFYRLLGGRNNWYNLGAGYLASFVNELDIDVAVYNADYVEDGYDLNLRDVFYGKEDANAILANDNHPIWKEIVDVILEYDPELLGFSINFTMVSKVVEKIAKLVKRRNPDIAIVVGGPHVTLVPDLVMRNGNFDYAIRGEGEVALLQLIENKPLEKILGLSFSENGISVRHNDNAKFYEPLDALPFPKADMQLNKIKNYPENFRVIATSRGCPFSCAFCSSPKIWGNRVRYRSVYSVLREITYRVKNYRVRKYYFSDDNFNLNKKYVLHLCKEMVNWGLDIEWICEAQLRTFDREILEAMKEAGCKRVKLGIESGNNRILKLMNKNTTKEKIRGVVKLIKEVGIDITAYFLIGMPTETKEEMLESLAFAEEIDSEYISLSVASPQYGTKLFDMMGDLNIDFDVNDWLNSFHQSRKSILNENVSDEIIEKFLELDERKNFARKI